jgi:RND family efflux transporter MFP subunit
MLATISRSRPARRRLRVLVSAAALCLAALAAPGCTGGRQAAAGPPPMGPVAVSLQTVEPKPVDQSTEFVATLRSRRSSEIRPQVEGIITRILVRSGAKVSAGTPLLQIDPAKQEATVSNAAAQRVAQEAAVKYAEQEYERQRKLFAGGLVSREALDTATTTLDTARASLKALEAQEQVSRVELHYYTVAAPTGGIVGDIPVRVGDRVITSTVLTTIDENLGLEAYIYVPVERSHDLRPGLTVRLVDDRGDVLEQTALSFISPQVDDRTQAVLVKAPVPAGHGFRTEQFVRARIVWSTAPALTVPVLAVSRINGQYLVFVAEHGDKGLVARQRPLRVGDVIGNDYVVLDGLKAGDQIVVSGIQKLADGVPVAPQAS